MLTQLNPPLPMHTPKGDGLAHFVIDYGPEADLLWVVFMDADGACWSVPNPEVRLQFNWSMGRRKPQASDAVEPTPARVHRAFPRAAEP
jgi:hypothetical protein